MENLRQDLLYMIFFRLLRWYICIKAMIHCQLVYYRIHRGEHEARYNFWLLGREGPISAIFAWVKLLSTSRTHFLEENKFWSKTLKALILSKEMSFQQEQLTYISNNNEVCVKEQKSKITYGSINCDFKTMSRTVLNCFSIKYAEPWQTKYLQLPTESSKL